MIEVGAVLVEWMEARFGGPVRLAEPMVSKGEGFDSQIHLFRAEGPSLPDPWREPLVLRVKPDVDRTPIAHREENIHAWLADRRYPTPRILAVVDPGEMLDRPVQVIERAPGGLLIDQFLGKPWRFRSMSARFAGLHARLHQMDLDGFPQGGDLLERRLALTRHTADALDHEGLWRGIALIEALSDGMRGAEPSVCHGDYHPLNVLVAGEDWSVIDWTDAGVGDRHGDVARTLLLFSVAHIAASSAAERAALRVAGPLLGRAYRRAYERHTPLDRERLALWTPVHLLHGWSQALGVIEGRFGDEPDARVRPGLADDLARRFEGAVQAVGA